MMNQPMKANFTLNVRESIPGVVPTADSRAVNAAWTGLRGASIDPTGASLLARIWSTTLNATVTHAHNNESSSATDQPLNTASGQPRELRRFARVLGHRHLRAVLIPVCFCSGLVSGCLTPQSNRKASSTRDTFANAGSNPEMPPPVKPGWLLGLPTPDQFSKATLEVIHLDPTPGHRLDEESVLVAQLRFHVELRPNTRYELGATFQTIDPKRAFDGTFPTDSYLAVTKPTGEVVLNFPLRHVFNDPYLAHPIKVQYILKQHYSAEASVVIAKTDVLEYPSN